MARRLFAKRGYADVGTEEIVRRAGVTRGALYHHFSGKEDLFRAVAEQVEEETTRKSAEAALAHTDPWEQQRAGWEAFLDALPRPGRAAHHPAGRTLGAGAQGVARDRIEVRPGAGPVRHRSR